ncbi:hypothetical protein B0H16DRAFT_1329730, partial [Mycena metata]
MSSSLNEVRAKIDELSADRELHKQVLADLDRGLSIARRELNAILDPMVKLPLEIWSEIFMLSFDNCPYFPGVNEGPLLLLRVSHLWTHIALSTPALWAAFRSTDVDGANFRKVFDIWVGRAGTSPLSLSL